MEPTQYSFSGIEP